MATDIYAINDTDSTINVSTTEATLDTDSSQGANAALVFTAIPRGVRGNKIKVAQTVPADDNAAHPIAVSVDPSVGGFAVITIQLAVSSDGSTITSTGDDIKAAVLAHAEASRLVSVEDKAANDGSGLASAFAATALTGGAKDDVMAGEIREIDAVADADLAALVAAGATVCLQSGLDYQKRRSIARAIKYGKVSAVADIPSGTA